MCSVVTDGGGPSTERNDISGTETNMTNELSTLVGLGFSEYEARTYGGLVGRAPMTGYAIAKDTGVPQPKVYETLNRLATRGAVVQVGSDPATWVAMPPSQLLAQLDNDFRRRLATAELELSRLGDPNEKGRVRALPEMNTWAQVADVAAAALGEVSERLYVSTHADQLEGIADEIMEIDRRGVRIDVLCFGETPMQLPNGSVVRHRSTEGTLYPHHQARHLAMVADGRYTIWALARNGSDWVGVSAVDDPLLAAVVKGYIRHDLYVQRIYRDLGPELEALYGPSLERLVNPATTSNEAEQTALGLSSETA